MDSNPHPVQIIKYNSASKKYELNLPVLEDILLARNARDANIAVISIAGALRKGKSFMLSFFLRYLEKVYDEDLDPHGDWLGNENEHLEGFPWRGGSHRHTTGIWAWSKIYTKILENGERIGVMLIDTQGTFDSHSTSRDNITIFSLSTMLSSVQIYNVFNNIQEDNLQHLQLFTEYGKLSLESNSEKPFQMLLFLVRDWNFPYEEQYGYEGGRNLLNKKLEITDDQDQELTYIRTHIKSCYEKIDCFLMPHPGRIVTESQNFTGQLHDISLEFKEMLKIFVPSILAPENVLTKTVNGAQIKGKNLINFFESYWVIFERGDVPAPGTLLNATATANNYTAKEIAIEFYQREMQSRTNPNAEIFTLEQMMRFHTMFETLALKIFDSKTQFGDPNLKEHIIENLKLDLQQLFILYSAANDAKRTNNLNQTIDNLSTECEAFEQTNEEQKSLIDNMKEEIENFKKLDDEDKKKLDEEIRRLKNEPEIIKDPPRISIKNIEERFKTIGESIRNETERFQHKLDRELERAEDNIRDYGRNLDIDLNGVGQKVEKEAKRIGEQVVNEAERARKRIQEEAKKARNSIQREAKKCSIM